MSVPVRYAAAALAGVLAVTVAPAAVAAPPPRPPASAPTLVRAALLPTTITGFSARTVTVNQGSSFAVTARVSGPGRRVVVVQRLSGKRWVNVVTAKTSARGALSLKVKATVPGTVRYRLVVPRVGLFAAKVSAVKVAIVKKLDLRAIPKVITGTFTGEDKRATWQGSIELTAVGGTTWTGNAYFKVSWIYEVTKLSGSWTWKANQGGDCSRSGGGAIALADVQGDVLFANGVERKVARSNYFDPWGSTGVGPAYDFRLRFTNDVSWPFTDTCPDPYGDAPRVTSGSTGPPFLALATADGIDTVAGLTGAMPTSDGNAFAGSVPRNYQGTTFTWNLTGDLQMAYPRPGS